MQFLLMVYTNPALLDALPPAQFNREMCDRLAQADELQQQDTLRGFQFMECPATARAVRQRAGRSTVLHGPLAQTEDARAGFTLIEAPSLDVAMAIAPGFAWMQPGCLKVRPARDVDAVRRMGAATDTVHVAGTATDTTIDANCHTALKESP